MNLIVAVGSNNEIGIDNELPWKQSEDLKNFRKLTTGNVVIMGRKTYESIGKPLPNRFNIVLTSEAKILNSINSDENLIFVSKISEMSEFTKNYDGNQLFVIGGAQIYNEFLKTDLIEKIYLTKIITPIFKEIPENYVILPNFIENYNLIFESELLLENEKNQYPYQFLEYVKNN